jgi:hypothetical protein
MASIDAFILGAGFSIAVEPGVMPDTDGLGKCVLETQKSIHRAPQRRHSDTCDGLSCDTPLLVNGTWPAPSFEVWLSRLAEPQPYLYEPENAERQALYERLVPLVADDIDDLAALVMRSNPPPWLLDLVGHWNEDEAAVVTLNYDTFVEATAEALLLGYPQSSPMRRSIQLKPHLIAFDPKEQTPDGRTVDAPMLKISSFKTLSLYKPSWVNPMVLGRSHPVYDSMVDIGQQSGWYCRSD